MNGISTIDYLMLIMMGRIMSIVIGLIRSSVIATITASIASVAITGGGMEFIPAATLILLFLLPSLLLYHIGLSQKFKLRTCDIIYAVPAVFFAIYLCIGSAMGGEGAGLSMFFLYVFLFAATGAFLAEINFRNKKLIKEQNHTELIEKPNFLRIFKKSRYLLIRSIRSGMIAVVVALVISTGPGFIDFRFEGVFIKYGLLFSLFTLPIIIVYHIACIVKVKRLLCDIIFWSAFVVVELFFLPGTLKISGEEISGDLAYLPVFAMSIIAVACIFIYWAEVYFRNWLILKNIQAAEKGADPIYSYPIRKSLVDICVFMIGIGIFATITCSVFALFRYTELRKQERTRKFVCQIIDSVHNRTIFYKNNSDEKAIEKLENSISEIFGNYDVTIGNYGFGHYNCRVAFASGEIFWANVEHEQGKFLLCNFMPEVPPCLLREKFRMNK